jgi:hypothetical protein
MNTLKVGAFILVVTSAVMGVLLVTEAISLADAKEVAIKTAAVVLIVMAAVLAGGLLLKK